MRISKVLLRRYKSFNVSFVDSTDRRADATTRSWNRLGVDDGGEDLPFIEIPIEKDITTIVGANESGKSHLLSAISKVATGHGNPSDPSEVYGRTDLCHFASTESANTDVWPEIGLELSEISAADWGSFQSLEAFAEQESEPESLTLVVANDRPGKGAQAHVFWPDGRTRALSSSELALFRQSLPTIRFIDAKLAINDHVDIGDLIRGYGGDSVGDSWFGFSAAQKAATALMSVPLVPGQPLDAVSAQALAQVREELEQAQMSREGSPDLEVLLFRDVLNVELDSLKYLASLPVANRSYADSVVASWNRRIDERLNLSRYWQQDDQFNLRINFKLGTLFFEITDKTGAVYTFRERSSGLRYFLSYYIQAKAIELSPSKPGVVLMDEPDSFLSVVGQRNLLSVFESLVSPDLSRSDTQLIYATHSPFLINRNFPRRIRLVRKGDAEEGTQYVDASRVRRYEPVRSALGIDCAQTMFMGATNLVLEGAVDQYLLCELIRVFSDRTNLHALLDLNSIVVVSAESATRIPKLLDASRWEDEANPAVVVLVDSDEEGRAVRELLIGAQRGEKQRVEPEFVRHVGEILGESIGEQRVITTEDLVPSGVYVQGIRRYAARYMKGVTAEHLAELGSAELSRNGLAKGAEEWFRRADQRLKGSYDKLGVAEEVIGIVRELRASGGTPEMCELERRLHVVCAALRETIAESATRERRESTRQALVRQIRSYLSQHREGSTLFDLQRLVKRMLAEVDWLGRDDLTLGDTLRIWQEEITKARAAGSDRIDGGEWKHAASALRRLQHDPFGAVPDVVLLKRDGGTEPRIELELDSEVLRQGH